MMMHRPKGCPTMMGRRSLLLISTIHAVSTSAFITPSGLPYRKDASKSKHHQHQYHDRDININVLIKKPLPATTATSTTLQSSKVSSARNLAIAGRIPWKKLVLTKAQFHKVFSIMRAETHILDLLLLFIFSVFPDHVGEFLYNNFLYKLRKDHVPYEESITYEIADTISDASRIAVLCYFIDAIEVSLEVSGIKGKKVDVSTIIAKLIYASWASLRVRLYKRSVLETFVERTAPRKIKLKQGNQGLVEIFDKFTDFILFVLLAVIWTDILQIRGKGLSSLFALGGAGTFALTFASQDLVKKVLNGLALSATDAFHVGDSILLGDGTSGIVTSVGWLTTDIKGTDELITKIPNSQLSNIRVSNRSRMKFSQVKQILHFKYTDLEKIPTLVQAIKDEIATSCPKVVTDGSRVFRVRWIDYEHDHVKVLVDCRLRNPPTGEKYFKARQGVLEAIARAVRKEGMNFALPTGCEYGLDYGRDYGK